MSQLQDLGKCFSGFMVERCHCSLEFIGNYNGLFSTLLMVEINVEAVTQLHTRTMSEATVSDDDL